MPKIRNKDREGDKMTPEQQELMRRLWNAVTVDKDNPFRTLPEILHERCPELPPLEITLLQNDKENKTVTIGIEIKLMVARIQREIR